LYAVIIKYNLRCCRQTCHRFSSSYICQMLTWPQWQVQRQNPAAALPATMNLLFFVARLNLIPQTPCQPKS